MGELPSHGAQKAAVARDPHQHLRNTQGHDLGVAELAPRVRGWLGQQIVRCAVDSDSEQVEVGVHRGLLVDGAFDTADFDLPKPVPICPGYAVASII
jgi:hypothetical protein